MIKLTRSYNAVVVKFLAKREKMQRMVSNLREQGKWEAHKRFNDVLQAADALKLEIGQKIALNNIHEKAVIKAKLKKLKAHYKLLHQESKPQWQQLIETLVVAGAVCLFVRNFLFGIYHVPTGSAEKTILVGDRIWGNKTAYFFETIKRGDMVTFDDQRQGYDESHYATYLWQRYVGVPIPLLGIGSGPINVVKRVIAIPGDVIEGRIEDGKTSIYLNNEKLDESAYLNPFPLIELEKEKGLIKQGWLGPIPVPDFLAQEKKIVHYTYDPSVSYAEQRYYCMDEAEVVKDSQSGEPIVRQSQAPIYYGSRCIDEFGPIRLPENKYWVMGDSRQNSYDSRGWDFLDKKYIHGRASFIIWSLDSEEAFWFIDLIKHPIDFWKKHVRWNRFFKLINSVKFISSEDSAPDSVQHRDGTAV